jgi:hypothetical protein
MGAIADVLRSYAVSVASIVAAGNAGYKSDVLMVPYALSVQKVDEVLAANALLIAENDRLVKANDALRYGEEAKR